MTVTFMDINMNLKVFFSIFGFLANSLTCISQISINSGGLFDNRN
jgi:hypothetical protein